jgi:death-on-curing protein
VEIELFYPTVDDVLALYGAIVGISPHQARLNVRDLNILDSALARPQNEAAYEGASLARQAATLLWGIARNHPYQDGNKRTAYVVAQAFLRGNGATMSATKDERYDVVMAVARGDWDVGQLEAWLDSHLARWSQEHLDNRHRDVGRLDRKG